MYKLWRIVLAFCVVFICIVHVVMGQQVAGKWKNSYGSVMELASPEEGLLEGIYSSSTGSTGKYRVLGTYSSPSSAGGIAVTLTILWNSIDGATHDPSRFWVSVMAGAYYPEEDVMELINEIGAAEAFSAVNVLMPGIYPETLTFTRASGYGAPPTKVAPSLSARSAMGYGLASREAATRTPGYGASPIKMAASPSERSAASYGVAATRAALGSDADALEGTWRNSQTDAPCSQLVIGVKDGKITASLSCGASKTIPAVGLTAAPASTFQAAAIASSPLPNGDVVGLVGLLNLAKNQLKMTLSRSSGVAYKNKYAATAIDVFYFVKD